MALPTTSIRVNVKQRLYDLVKSAAPPRWDESGPVQVNYGGQGDLENECIWFGAIEGQSEPANISGGTGTRVRRNDDFTVAIWCGVRDRLMDDPEYGGQYEADRQCEALLHAIEDILAANPGLGTTGINDDVLPGIVSAWIEEFNGPSPADLSETGLGYWMSAATLRVLVKTRLI